MKWFSDQDLDEGVVVINGLGAVRPLPLVQPARSSKIKSKGIPCTMSSPQLDIHLVVEKYRMLRLTIMVIATARPSSPSRRTISVIAAALRGLPQGNHRKRTPSQGKA